MIDNIDKNTYSSVMKANKKSFKPKKLSSAALKTIEKKIHTEQKRIHRLIVNIMHAIRGKNDKIKLLLTALLAGGHLLIEDIPGTGKTTLAKVLARSIKPYGSSKTKHLHYQRIQFTPDLLPADITGVDIFDMKSKRFQFNPGPVFTNILLADEINRGTPKVQSALLESMGERQVTVGKKTYPLPAPYFVIGTQNPIEMEGTYPLPIAQLDRFYMQIDLGYPERSVEVEILNDTAGIQASAIRPVIGVTDLQRWQQLCAGIYYAPVITELIVSILEKSRAHNEVILGLNIRAGLMLLACAQAWAFLDGRAYITDHDIKSIAVPVLAHRIRLKNPAQNKAVIIQQIVNTEIDTYAQQKRS